CVGFAPAFRHLGLRLEVARRAIGLLGAGLADRGGDLAPAARAVMGHRAVAAVAPHVADSEPVSSDRDALEVSDRGILEEFFPCCAPDDRKAERAVDAVVGVEEYVVAFDALEIAAPVFGVHHLLARHILPLAGGLCT